MGFVIVFLVLVITLSLGVACLIPAMDQTPANLITAADEALYKAKESGRNQVVSASG